MIGIDQKQSDFDLFSEWIIGKRRIVGLEGPDGVGKTTQARLLCNYFNDLGISAETGRLPHYFRDTMFSDKVTEVEKVGLSLLDYDMVVNNWLDNSESDILILDRIAHVSIEVYNLPNVRPELKENLKYIVRQKLLDSFVPDVIFNFNRPSFRPPDDSYFERRTSHAELLERYENLGLLIYEDYISVVPTLRCIKLFGPEKLSLEVSQEEVTQFILENLREVCVE